MRSLANLYLAILGLAISIPITLIEELREEPFDYPERSTTSR